ncbi:MAG: glycosyltransferase family 2 protein, partial [Pseudomonadota bacterium]
MSTDFSIVAIISVFNEEDIIRASVKDLIENGIKVYLLDHGSTDQTVSCVEDFIGHGILSIERFPEDCKMTNASTEEYCWRKILQRKEQLAAELDATWFIHQDADEFRESPWTGVSLFDGIRLVDQLGFNIIDFSVLDFVPTNDNIFNPGDDPRQVFPYYQISNTCNRVQLRCWKKQKGALDLASSGGHEAVFAGRSIFPIRFLLRHYPFRSQAHGERKLSKERRPRYLKEEQKRGW